MKRYVILIGIVAALLILLLFVWPRGGGNPGTTEVFEVAAPRALADTNSDVRPDADTPNSVRDSVDSDSIALATNQDNEFLQLVRRADEAANVPVSFFGLVVDQDSNALQNVSVDLVVKEEWSELFPQVKTKRTSLQRQTGADGRFEVSGLRGKYVAVSMLTKTGYEEDYLGQGQWLRIHGAQSGSFGDPVVFRMWSTNLHEPLVTGEKSFVVIPDGRRYAIDLIKGTISEGEQGDLVVWIKRPEPVRWGQRYDWSCELAVPDGGLLESESQMMFTAPEAGYTNMFADRKEANSRSWGFLTGDRRFYVRLRNGQMYGSIMINLYADYHGKKPAMIRLSYAVNPSGSRILR